MIHDLVLFLNDFILPIIFIVNILFAITVVFIERKNPTATIAWLMALLLLPVVGFILYLFVGQSFYRERMFRVKKEDDESLTTIIESQKKELFVNDVPGEHPISDAYKRMMFMLMESNKAPVTVRNEVSVFIDGNDKFKALVDAIRGAQDHIHLEY
jgi:cardiolipin synthase